MAISDADRAFLSKDWRWVETADQDTRTRFPGAREAEYGSAFMSEFDATAALAIINAVTIGKVRVINAAASGIVPMSFAGKPPTVRLYYDRFGGDPVSGQLFIVTGAVLDYAADRTILTLIG